MFSRAGGIQHQTFPSRRLWVRRICQSTGINKRAGLESQVIDLSRLDLRSGRKGACEIKPADHPKLWSGNWEFAELEPKHAASQLNDEQGSHCQSKGTVSARNWIGCGWGWTSSIVWMESSKIDRYRFPVQSNWEFLTRFMSRHVRSEIGLELDLAKTLWGRIRFIDLQRSQGRITDARNHGSEKGWKQQLCQDKCVHKPLTRPDFCSNISMALDWFLCVGRCLVDGLQIPVRFNLTGDAYQHVFCLWKVWHPRYIMKRDIIQNSNSFSCSSNSAELSPFRKWSRNNLLH